MRDAKRIQNLFLLLQNVLLHLVLRQEGNSFEDKRAQFETKREAEGGEEGHQGEDQGERGALN